jgi:hypothetical protein
MRPAPYRKKTTQESLVPTETNGGKGFSAFFWISDFVEYREFFFGRTDPPRRPVKAALRHSGQTNLGLARYRH